MILDHEAIRKSYPSVITIDESIGALDKDKNPVVIDQAQVDAARVALDNEAAAVQYKTDRQGEYPSIGDQLDMLYWDKKNSTSTWIDAIESIKNKYPKPSS